MHLPLRGVRVHLTGSVPEDAGHEQSIAIAAVVEKLSRAIFREGGTIIHGSHPSFREPLARAAKAFVESGGSKDALILVRPEQYAVTAEQMGEIEQLRGYSVVHIIPAAPGKPAEGLVSMREWMAERCDVFVAIGGKWYGVNKQKAGVPNEIEEALRRGKPGFLLGGFGGATGSLLSDDPSIFARLRNGLGSEHNRALANTTNADEATGTIVSQIGLLPLFRESVSRGRLFRVLALDGGGLRGTFTAAVLAKWEEMLGPGIGPIAKHFDLVAGTSTGAILAIGLSLGLSATEILKFYREKGPSIFPKDRKLRHWLKSKHDAQTLRAKLETVFGDRKLSDGSSCRLVIPTVRANRGEADAIVTPHSLDRTGFKEISAVDAAMASSAAPTYFDEAFVDNEVAAQSYLDGGIWANNPVLPAIAEAMRHLKVPLDRIDVLSVGTMANESDFTEALRKGKAGWAPHTVDLFFAAQEHAAAALADAFLSRARHLRINQQSLSEIKLDDTEAIEDMAQRGANVGKDSFVTVRSRFLDGFHAPDWRNEIVH